MQVEQEPAALQAGKALEPQGAVAVEPLFPLQAAEQLFEDCERSQEGVAPLQEPALASVQAPQRCLVVSHTGPAAEAAQSVLVLQQAATGSAL